ncbi:nicotinate (nicotinamide) nucleotide adenylyltransferase [Inhella sp.]|uniref:nicotinate (nicotinamide) nucleotide adenylyltransferase n=1 Tax=Inhella sp. TaxID=1921806 RepID=UPI0035B251AB
MKFGLFGGSFNPPHRAHRALAQLAIEQLALDELIVMPAGQPWQKAGSALAPAEHRLTMTRLLLQDLPRVQVSAWEAERAEPSTSIATLEHLQAQHPGAEWFLVIGQDQYEKFSSWKRWPELLQRCTLAVAGRAGQLPHPDPALPAHRSVQLALPADRISATALRADCARGADISPMVGPDVAGYIAHHHLYGA